MSDLLEYITAEVKLTSGEKIAVTRGCSLITPEQMCGIYLLALGKAEDRKIHYVSMIKGIESFGEVTRDGSLKISDAAIADAIEMESYITLQRTTRKFKNMILNESHNDSEILYPKVIKAFNLLNKIKPQQIAEVVSITDTPYTLNRNKIINIYDKQKCMKIDKEKRNRNILIQINSITSQLKKIGFPIEKALSISITKLSSEFNLSKEELYIIYKSNY